MPMRRSFFILFALLGVLWTSASFSYAEDATALVKRTTENMLKTLEARRSEVDRDPSLIFGMIESGVAPHFDFERITQGAVGQSWRDATPAQQRALVNGFKQVLVRTYARSILSYSGQEIRYLPVKPGRQASTVTVSTEIISPGSAPIPVDYRMHNNAGGWKVYDVVINNASLVGNYRTSFSNEIRQGGIDGLIAKLGEMNIRTRQ
ncbi:MlaC/ttg2D family ABC transporter substrate-binding protein [Thiocapsa rosea]|uniref:Phospholipid transport system substrate-binding protein n=1 Tax=Thiocapsa rosea TaxID=69360 RepID=A0A495V7J6_9GAMM|nr:ABC transporter substrate-binding protein [Thiocapsa rosea]RKT43738.1 phospholipid transport system substrate-binding protein [Thiocapsa rosea]